MSNEIKFLEKYADTLGLRDKPRKVFLERFNQSYFSKDSTVLGKNICGESNDPAQTFQDHLKTVLIALSEAGSPHKNVGRGRPKKEQQPWKEAYEWLWDKPYAEYLEKCGTKPPIALDELCRESSRRSYRHLTISKNPLMAEIGLTADQNNVVSLEIVERERISKKREDIQNSDQGSSFYQPTENEQGEKFSTTDSFLDDVIRDRKTKKSQGMRIAITGEAGAGKTTLLQSIGIYLEKLNKDLVPIWISLKQVTKSIEAYLVDEYLREITGILPNLPIPSEYSKSLNNLLKSGQVILLLVGADESTERNILGNLGEQINKPIFNMVLVVLTCRLNTWDTQWQSSFDVYQIIPFTYPVQVESFIDRFSWGDGENLAGDLKKVLKDENKSRLVDMVKNPLRLALLCYLWKNGQQRLPNTRAELYRSMLEAFYRQKELEFGSPSKDLKNALSQLALSAFNKEEYRYLLPESDVSKLLGSLNDKGSLFWQATKKFGLLNQVGKSSINPNENTYAFYHASFQEYFAALAIQALDSEYFLPTECDSNNLDSIKLKKYRVFCQEWKDVILFWIGRMDIENFMKETLIYKLMLFQDNCGDFYRLRALCIATECLSEFSQIKYVDLLISWITSYAFIHDLDKYTRYLYNNNYKEEVRSILKKTRVKELIVNLEKRIFQCADREGNEDPTNDFYLEDFELAKILFFVDPNNQLATNKIVDLLDNNKKYHFNAQDLEDLRQLYLLSPITFNNIPKLLINLLSEKKHKYITKDILRVLTSIIDAINYHFLIVNIVEIASNKLLDNDLDYIIDIVEFLLLLVNDKESEIDVINLSYTKFIHELEELLLSLNNEFETNKKKLFAIAECLTILDPCNLKAINFFFDCFEIPQDYISLEKICKNLIVISKASKNIKNYLFELLEFQTDEIYKFRIANILINVDPSEENKAAKILVELLETNVTDQNSWIIEESAKLLVKHNLFSKLAITPLKKLAQSGDYSAAHFLAVWSPKNFIAIDALLTVFDTEPKYAFIVSHDLTEIDLGEHKNDVVVKLENIITLHEYDYFKNKIYDDSKHSYELDVSKIQEYIFDLPTISKNILLIDSKNIMATSFLLRLIETLISELKIDKENNSIEAGEVKSKAHKWHIKKKEQLLDRICESIEKSELCHQIIQRLKFFVHPSLKDKSYAAYQSCHKILWYFSQNMNYPDFYEAWHSQPTSTHPEITDTIPSNNTNKIQTLESQLIDCEAIQKELYRNTDHPKIRCLVVDMRQLEQESYPNVIARKLTNKIFNSIGRRIPVVQDVSCLERELLNLKLEPDFENLAIALYGKSANEAIHQLCQSLTESIPIRPFTGGQTTQELITKINAWLSEM